MAERERRLTPPYGGVFVARTRVMSADDMQRATWRMAHEIIERNHGLESVVLIGLQTGGVPLAARLGEALQQIESVEVPVGLPRRGLLPRRHRAAARAPRGGDRHPRRPRRPHGGAGRRRAVHRPHHPGRPRRPRRLRPGPGGPAGGDGRPRPPGAADPARLRGQEPARPDATRWSTSTTTASTSGRWSSEPPADGGRDPAQPARHRRPRAPTWAPASTRCSSSPTRSWR